MTPIAIAAPRPAMEPPIRVDRSKCNRARAGRSGLSSVIEGLAQSKGAADWSATPEPSDALSLLQVAHRGQGGRQLDDAGRAAPVGAVGGSTVTRVDRRHESRARIGGREV